MFRQICPLLLLTVCLNIPTWLHAKTMITDSGREKSIDTAKTKIASPEINYAIGIYLGANNAGYNTHGNTNINPSYMVYSLFKLSEKLEILTGLGQISYSGKSLGYIENKTAYGDTVTVKNYSVNRISYFTMPVILKLRIGNHFKLGAGVRFSVVNEVDGSGTTGYYLTSRPDSVIIQSHISPGLPPKANKYDIGAILGLEYGFNKNCWISLQVNAGLNPIYPSIIPDIYGPRAGNNNISAELGLHYLFYNNRHKID